MLLALLSGGLLVFSFPKFGLPALAWIALAPLITAVAQSAHERRMIRRPFALGMLAGLVYFSGTIYWVHTVMVTYGGLHWMVAALVALLLASYLAIYVALFAALTAAAVRHLGVKGVWLVPIFWVSTEYARGYVGGGFPWAPLGASQASVVPVVQLASVTGVWGLSALVALVSAAASAVALSRRRAHLIGAALSIGIVAIVASVGALRVAGGSLVRTGEVVRVGLVQGSIEQAQKWNPAFRDAILRRYLDLSSRVIAAGAAIVIWPESSTPFFFDADSRLAAPVRQLAADSRTPFVIGSDIFEAARPDAPQRIYNAAVVIDSSGRPAGDYRKMRLVPFGEYVPLRDLLFFVAPLVESVGDFTPGEEAVVLQADGARIGLAICFESVYPSISRAFVARGSELLATITNDAWFGRSSAPHQHFEQGALRAVEGGRYLVRAANTGISGAFDPYGRVMADTPLFEPAAITVDVRLLSTRTIYSRTGDVIPWVSIVASLAFLVALRRRRRRT